MDRTELSSSRTSAVVVACASLLFGIGCGGSPVRVAHRNAVDSGASYRTYAVLQHPVNRGELDETVGRALEELMRERGYAPADASQADMHISYGVLLGDPPGGRGQPIARSDLDGEIDAPSRPKTLVLMLQDAASRRVVWLGVSSTSGTDAELRERARQALVELGTWVPRAGGS